MRWLKDWKERKIGDISNAGKKSAENFVSQGYAEYVDDTKKELKKQKKEIQQDKEIDLTSSELIVLDEAVKRQLTAKLLSLPLQEKEAYRDSFEFQNADEHKEWVERWKSRKFEKAKYRIQDIEKKYPYFLDLSPLELSKEIKEISENSDFKESDIKKGFSEYKRQKKEFFKKNKKEEIKQEENIKIHCSKRIAIELPGDDSLISDFSKKLSDKFKDTEDIFYRTDLRECVEITHSGFEILQPSRFVTLAEKYFSPWTKKFGKFGEYSVKRSMTQQTSRIVLSSDLFRCNIKNIKRIFTCPIPIIYNGKLTIPKKGYDERFNSWLELNSPEINLNIPFDEAKNIFSEIYGEFCFQDNSDFINAVAGLITPFLRGVFSSFNVRTPLFAYMANRERAGKDYCAGITGLVLEGMSLEEPPINSGEYKSSGMNDELRKKLLSSLIHGKKRLHFANNKGRLNNAVLEGFLTSKVYSDRILGRSETLTFNNEIDVSISGNIGMTFTADLLNRSRIVNLFLDIEDANKREFNKPDLHKWVLENRGYIISCIFSIVKDWVNNGMKKGESLFTSFQEWADVCGGVMENAGFGNPCVADAGNSMGISLDNETDEMKEFFEIMNKRFNDNWISKDEMKIALSNEDVFQYINWDDKSDQIRFGKKLECFTNRILSDIKMISDNNKKSQRRKYKFVRLHKTYNDDNNKDISVISDKERIESFWNKKTELIVK